MKIETNYKKENFYTEQEVKENQGKNVRYKTAE